MGLALKNIFNKLGVTMFNRIESKSKTEFERSIFQTNEPRAIKITVHLFLVFFSFLSALVIAIIFAETQTKNPALAEQRTSAKQLD
jgi:hypothetical protein